MSIGKNDGKSNQSSYGEGVSSTISSAGGSGSASSRSSSPGELSSFYNTFNKATGGVAGRLSERQPIKYSGVSPEQIKALGGLGSTRERQISSALTEAKQIIGSDPSLSLFQRQRALQLASEEASGALDAVGKETEAAISGLANTEADRSLKATVDREKLLNETAAVLAQIFFGGKGQFSSSNRSNSSSSVSNSSTSNRSTGASKNDGFNIGL